MRKQMFLKSYLMKIAFLLVFLTGAVPTYSAVLLVDHQLDTPLLQGLDISQSFIMAIIVRIFTLWVAIVVGFISLHLISRKNSV